MTLQTFATMDILFEAECPEVVSIIKGEFTNLTQDEIIAAFRCVTILFVSLDVIVLSNGDRVGSNLFFDAYSYDNAA